MKEKDKVTARIGVRVKSGNIKFLDIEGYGEPEQFVPFIEKFYAEGMTAKELDRVREGIMLALDCYQTEIQEVEYSQFFDASATDHAYLYDKNVGVWIIRTRGVDYEPMYKYRGVKNEL